MDSAPTALLHTSPYPHLTDQLLVVAVHSRCTPPYLRLFVLPDSMINFLLSIDHIFSTTVVIDYSLLPNLVQLQLQAKNPV